MGNPISKQEKQTVGIVAKLIEKSPIARFAITDVNETKKEKKRYDIVASLFKNFIYSFSFTSSNRVSESLAMEEINQIER